MVAMFCAAAASLGGCGWTARDEFIASRKSSLAAKPGDGSLYSSGWKAGGQTASSDIAARLDSQN
jgi:hypothetical protein